MLKDHIFKIALIISLIIHAIILSSLPHSKNNIKESKLSNIKLTYKYISKEAPKKDITTASKTMFSGKQTYLPRATLPIEEPKVKESIKFDISKTIRPKEAIAIPNIRQTTNIQRTNVIKLKDLVAEASKDPAYLSYRNVIRKRIQDKVYLFCDQFSYFNNPREGKIFITFTIDAQGNLKDLVINDAKSSEDDNLKKIVLAALKDASPFEKFPQDLKYAERVFSLEISFEIE